MEKKLMFIGEMYNKKGKKFQVKIYETNEFMDIGHVFVDNKDTNLLLSVSGAAEYVRQYCA